MDDFLLRALIAGLGVALVSGPLGAFVVWGIWTGTQFMPGFLSDPNFRYVMVGILMARGTWRSRSRSTPSRNRPNDPGS